MGADSRGGFIMEKFDMDLQLFAEDVTSEEGDSETKAKVKAKAEENKDVEAEDDGEEKTEPEFTDAQLEIIKKMVQSETDKVRTKYVKKVKELEEEKNELLTAKMTVEEKAEHDRKVREKELAEKERELSAKENRLYAIDALKKSEMPLDFLEFVVGADEGDTDTKIATLSQLWTKALNKAISERMKGIGRKPGSGDGQPAAITKEQFAKMKYTEKLALRKENPQLYAELTKALTK